MLIRNDHHEGPKGPSWWSFRISIFNTLFWKWFCPKTPLGGFLGKIIFKGDKGKWQLRCHFPVSREKTSYDVSRARGNPKGCGWGSVEVHFRSPRTPQFEKLWPAVEDDFRAISYQNAHKTTIDLHRIWLRIRNEFETNSKRIRSRIATRCEASRFARCITCDAQHRRCWAAVEARLSGNCWSFWWWTVQFPIKSPNCLALTPHNLKNCGPRLRIEIGRFDTKSPTKRPIENHRIWNEFITNWFGICIEMWKVRAWPYK